MNFSRSGLTILALPLVLSAVALLAPACGSSVAGTGGSGGGSGGAAACPSTTPQDGTACTGPSTACSYPMHCCGDTTATCVGGKWQVQLGGCIAEVGPDPCPATVPIAGTACTPGCLPVLCTYGMCGDGNPEYNVSCDGTSWTVTDTCPPDGGGGIPLGGLCGPDADGGSCASGLACCYPCGMPGCQNQCVTACQPGDPGCAGGCLQVP